MDIFFDQIDSFLAGELSDAETAAFEQAMQSNPKLVRAVTQHRVLHQRLLGLQMRKKVTAALDDSTEIASKRTSLWPWIVGLVITGGTLFLMWPTQSVPDPSQLPSPLPLETTPRSAPTATPLPDTASLPKSKILQNNRVLALAQQYFVTPPNELIRAASQTEPDDSPLQKASNAFAQGDYTLACTLLRDEAIPRSNHESSLFLRACACFKAGQYKNAGADFKSLEHSFQYQYEAQWNRLLCEMAQGNHRFVQNNLNTMVVDADFPFNPSAKQLKKALQQDFSEK